MSESVKPLISLDPIGVGTSRVESLDSYAHRVAAAHRVPRSYVDMLVNLESQFLPRPKFLPKSPSLNGPSESARSYGNQIAGMTGRPLAVCLNLGVYAGVLSPIGAQRQVRAWCNGCINDRRSRGEEPYWPLIWSIPDYVICDLHGTELTSQCNACSGTTRLNRSWKGDLFVCRHCNVPLDAGFRETRNLRQLAPSKFHAYDKIANSLVSELVADVSRIQLEGLAVGNNFQRLLQHVGEVYGIDATPATVAKLADLSRATTHSLSRGTLLPSLSVLTRLALTFEVSISGLICPSLWQSKILRGKEVGLVPRKRVLSKRDWDNIRNMARQSASTNTPETPYRLLVALGACPKTFNHKFRDETLELRNKVKFQRESEFMKMVEELAVKLVAAKNGLNAQGLKVSKRKLSRAVGVDRTTRLYKVAMKLNLQ